MNENTSTPEQVPAEKPAVAPVERDLIEAPVFEQTAEDRGEQDQQVPF